jgi:hypothetical protein
MQIERSIRAIVHETQAPSEQSASVISPLKKRRSQQQSVNVFSQKSSARQLTGGSE